MLKLSLLLIFTFLSCVLFSQDYIMDDIERANPVPKKMIYYKHECPLVNDRGTKTVYFLNRSGKIDSSLSYSKGELMLTFKYNYNDQNMVISEFQRYGTQDVSKQTSYYIQYENDEYGKIIKKKIFGDKNLDSLLYVEDNLSYDIYGNLISLTRTYFKKNRRGRPIHLLYGYNNSNLKAFKKITSGGDSSIYKYFYDADGFIDSVYEERHGILQRKFRTSDNYTDVPFVERTSYGLSYKSDRKGNWKKCFVHISGKKYLFIVRKIYY